MKRKKRQWSIDPDAATATSSDGWVFAFAETENGEELDVECLDHPENLSGKQLDAAEAIAGEAAAAFMDAMGESEAITIDNDGSEIAATSFWDSNMAKNGHVFVSVHGGAIRMLVPPPAEAGYLPEMKTAKDMLIEPSQQHDNCLDFVFDDGTDTPFWVAVDTRQMDALPAAGKNVPFFVYTRSGRQLVLRAEVQLPAESGKKKRK